MTWLKAKLTELLGRKKETDGIALRNERLRTEGEHEKQRGHAEAQNRRGRRKPY
ncbi:hypothetical protein [Streptomyces sp. NPDC054866]